jgi:hypothetical protein
MSTSGNLAMSGSLGIKVHRAPGPGLLWKIKNLPHRLRGWRAEIGPLLGFGGFYAELSAVLHRKDGSVVNYGVLSRRKVTSAFVEFMVDQLQTETSAWGDFKYHDSGVGVTAESNADTDIETTDGEDRVAGTQEEGASANIYKSVGTIAYTTTKAITEHGLFNASTAGTLLDRSVFSAVNVVDGDSITFTYQLTCSAEA